MLTLVTSITILIVDAWYSKVGFRFVAAPHFGVANGSNRCFALPLGLRAFTSRDNAAHLMLYGEGFDRRKFCMGGIVT